MDFFGILTGTFFDLGSEQLRLRFDEPKESEFNCRTVATLLKAVCCFLQLCQGLKLGNPYFERFLWNSPGLLKSITSLFESLERLKNPFDYLSSCGFGVRSNSGRREKFTDYQRKVVVLNCLRVIDASIGLLHLHIY